MIASLWRTVSSPRRTFEQQQAHEPALLTSSLQMLASGVIGIVVFALAFARLTNSSLLPVVALSLVLGVTNLLIIWALGGLTLIRPANLDLRAWDIAAQSWLPLGFIAVALLPVVFFFPLPAMLVGVLGAQVWHLLMIYSAMQVYAPDRLFFTTVLYVLIVQLLPVIMFSGIFMLFVRS